MMRPSAMVILYSPRCLDYSAPGHPENPDRVRAAVAQLHKEFHTWVVPEPCTDDDILRVHTPALLDAVRSGALDDIETPFYPNIFDLAKLSAGAAVLAAQHALDGRPAFSLMRPPGHHAERNRVMGFCYFNNIAIAVAKVLEVGRPRTENGSRKVAILDFDCHHGNGTEDIFRGNDRVLFVSMHQSPCYPYTGLVSAENIVNYPLPPGTGGEKFVETVDDAIDRIRGFNPQLLAISAGFDAYKGDPITHMDLEVETFYEIGQRVADLTQPAPTAPALPCFAVLEGGYSREFPQCVDAFLAGWERR
ncbi:MAG: histone deacetylase [Verrucomicrobiia bacterium]|jgi:acetoin utilization deacetylase AcuC-like enzyme